MVFTYISNNKKQRFDAHPHITCDRKHRKTGTIGETGTKHRKTLELVQIMIGEVNKLILVVSIQGGMCTDTVQVFVFPLMFN